MTTLDAAVLLQNAMDLSVSVGAMENVDENTPEWAAAAVAAMNENGIDLGTGELTRGKAAVILYQISKMVKQAPGLQMYQ